MSPPAKIADALNAVLGISSPADLKIQQSHSAHGMHPTRFSLGNIMVAKGLISRQQLDSALHRQIKSGQYLGEELVNAGHANRRQIESSLLLQSNIVNYALAVTVGLTPLAVLSRPAEASGINTSLSVSVTVPANAKLQPNYQATRLDITDTDIAQGYVVIAAASQFAISTNSRSGYLIEFLPVGNIFNAVQVSGLGNPVQLGAEGGIIVLRGPPLPGMTHELSFQFTLSPDVKPGSYPWPLQLSVRAL